MKMEIATSQSGGRHRRDGCGEIGTYARKAIDDVDIVLGVEVVDRTFSIDFECVWGKVFSSCHPYDVGVKEQTSAYVRPS